MITRTVSVLCITASLALLAACGGGPSGSAAQPAADSSSSSFVVGAIEHAIDKASAKLATHNITISGHNDNAPQAEITPQGDLLIAGEPVSLSQSQRAEVLAYRQQIVAIAQQGMTIGKRGAKLGVEAARTAIAGIFSGASDEQIQHRVKAKTAGIRRAAAKICDRLPALMQSQQKLAADVPAFRPYANLTAQKIDRCRSDLTQDNN